MPTYEYKCLKCGKIVEIQQSILDKSLTHKEHSDFKTPWVFCNGKLEKQISKNINIIFKGKGWTQKFHTKTGKGQSKLDAALNKLNIEDASDGWSKREDE